MRILQCINALTHGGAQVFLADLVRFLGKQGHEVHLAGFRDGYWGQVLRSEGVPIHILGESCLDLFPARRLRDVIRTFRPDIIHSHLFRATFWSRILAPSDCPLVTTIHGFESEGFHLLERLMRERSRMILFPSGFLRNWYQSHVARLSGSRHRVIYPGTVIYGESGTRMSGAVPGAVPLVLRGAMPRVGTLSRLHPVKGIDVLLRACRIIRDKGLSFEVAIGGEGKARDGLERLVAELGLRTFVTFHGPVQKSREFLQSLDVFVSPSREESFGITVCEAMEAGLPVIASAVGGIPEIITHGHDGFLFTPGGVEELADYLERCLTDVHLRRALGTAGRTATGLRFNRQTALQAHLDIYRKVRRTSPPKVHLAISSAELGGGERMALHFAKALRERGWKLSATCTGQPLAAKLTKVGINTSVCSGRMGGLLFFFALLRDLRQHRPGLVHTHLNKAALMAGLIRQFSAIPVLSHVHGLNRIGYYRLADHLLAVSKAVARHLEDQGASHPPITVLPNALPPISGSSSPPPEGPPWNILIPAKLHENKGHAWALAALEQDPRLAGEIRLWILGDGPEREPLEKRFLTGPLGEILTFWGFRKEPGPFYEKAHVILLPSLGEGIPLSLLEGLGRGLPCLATAVGGIPEIIEHGRNGLLFEPRDGAGLLQAMRTCLVPETWRRLAAGARQSAAATSFVQIIDQLERLCLTMGAFR